MPQHPVSERTEVELPDGSRIMIEAGTPREIAIQMVQDAESRAASAPPGLSGFLSDPSAGRTQVLGAPEDILSGPSAEREVSAMGLETLSAVLGFTPGLGVIATITRFGLPVVLQMLAAGLSEEDIAAEGKFEAALGGGAEVGTRVIPRVANILAGASGGRVKGLPGAVRALGNINARQFFPVAFGQTADTIGDLAGTFGGFLENSLGATGKAIRSGLNAFRPSIPGLMRSTGRAMQAAEEAATVPGTARQLVSAQDDLIRGATTSGDSVGVRKLAEEFNEKQIQTALDRTVEAGRVPKDSVAALRAAASKGSQEAKEALEFLGKQALDDPIPLRQFSEVGRSARRRAATQKVIDERGAGRTVQSTQQGVMDANVGDVVNKVRRGAADVGRDPNIFQRLFTGTRPAGTTGAIKQTTDRAAEAATVREFSDRFRGAGIIGDPSFVATKAAAGGLLGGALGGAAGGGEGAAKGGAIGTLAFLLGVNPRFLSRAGAFAAKVPNIALGVNRAGDIIEDINAQQDPNIFRNLFR